MVSEPVAVARLSHTHALACTDEDTRSHRGTVRNASIGRLLVSKPDRAVYYTHAACLLQAAPLPGSPKQSTGITPVCVHQVFDCPSTVGTGSQCELAQLVHGRYASATSNTSCAAFVPLMLGQGHISAGKHSHIYLQAPAR